jgi:DNA repair protein RadC
MIRDIPTGERPRERLRDRGADSLSNSELLAILLRTGTRAESALDMATKLLARYQGLEGLAKASFQELAQSHGVGEAKAAQLLAALELAKRLTRLEGPERLTIRSPKDVFDLLKAEMSLLDQEHFKVVVLNTKNQVMATPTVFVGSVNATTVRVAEVFREAVRQNCPAMIVVHNHPSGDPAPSPEDVSVTRELVAAGKALDVEVLDHVVIGRQGFVSLKEKGLGF